MPLRGFIIAIENYPKITSGEKQLPGTHKDAGDFYDWLVGTKQLNPADITFLTDDPGVPRRSGGAGMGDIAAALVSLVNAGRDSTNELYIFLSGHGFFYSDRGGRLFADILLSPDFASAAASGRECVDINALQQELRLSMGPGDHYYFIDACRTEITSSQVAVAGLGLTLPRSKLGQPAVYSLYSTRRGKTAGVGSGFAPRLIEGLNGKGRAKAWAAGKQNTMVVLFDRVRDFVKDKLSQEVDARVDGVGPGHILHISPAPLFTCTIVVENGQPTDQFQVTASNQQGQVVRQDLFHGKLHRFRDPPNDYFLTVTHATAPVDPVSSPAADLYDDCSVQFIKKAIMPGGVGFSVGGTAPAEATLDVAGVDGPVEVRDLSTGDVLGGARIFRGKVKPGPYLVKAKDLEGITIRKERIVLEPGSTKTLDLRPLARSAFRNEILAQLPAHAHTPEAVYFSETLGALTDDEPALWLSILGASRIVGDVDTFSKLKNFHLHTFEHYSEGDAPLYVLAGFTEPRRLSVGISESVKHIKRVADQVPFLPRVQQAAFKPKPGFRLLWLHPEKLASIAMATYGLPNRATLVVLAEDDSGAIALRHFMLPVHSLAKYLNPTVRSHFPQGSVLETVKFVARAQRDFERHRAIEPQSARAQQMWTELLHAKWIDPIMTIVASCELIRRGKIGMIPIVVRNLRRYFPGLADTEGIAKLAGLEWKLPASSPLFLECLQAFGSELELPLARGRLDYRSPWTVWRAADE